MRLRTLLLTALTIAFAVPDARAQTATVAASDAAPAAAPATPSSGWAFSLTPYVWIPAVSGNLRMPTLPLGGVPETHVHFHNNNLASSLSGFGFMGSAEARYDRFAVVADLMALTVADNVQTRRDLLFNGGNARLTSTTFSLYGYYRVVEQPWVTFDLGVGGRGYWIDTRLRLNPGLLPGGTVTPSVSWVDPLIAARASVRFAQEWGMSVFGDFGGFSVGSTSTWQLGGTIDWRPAHWVDIRAGWRYMSIDYSQGRHALDVALSGPIIGATFRF